MIFLRIILKYFLVFILIKTVILLHAQRFFCETLQGRHL